MIVHNVTPLTQIQTNLDSTNFGTNENCKSILVGVHFAWQKGGGANMIYLNISVALVALLIHP